jgi:hypothetical protein
MLEDFQPEPPRSPFGPAASLGELAVGCWNAPALRSAIERMIRAAPQAERTEARRRFLLRAAGLVGGPEAGQARKIHERLEAMRWNRPGFIDLGTLDGNVAAALLMNLWARPSIMWVRRALWG